MSPVSLSVVSNVKRCAMIAGSVCYFHNVMTCGSKVGTAICLFGAFLYQIVQKLPQKVLTFLFILLLLILPFDIENIVIFEEIFKEF